MLLYSCPEGLDIDYIIINYNTIITTLNLYAMDEALTRIGDFDILDEVASVFPDLARMLADPGEPKHAND